MERLSGIYQYPSTDEITGVRCGAGRTKQSFARECDINQIVSRAQRTGILSTGREGMRRPTFGDFSNAGDFLQMQLRLKSAEAEFLKLPIDLRARVGHSVDGLLTWLQDPVNRNEAVDLGLLEPVKPAPAPVQATTPAMPAASESKPVVSPAAQ